MPVKRSRIGSSSTFRESGVINHGSLAVDSAGPRYDALMPPSSSVATRPPANLDDVLKPSVTKKSDESRPAILTVSSPGKEIVDLGDHQPIGRFLEKCYRCNKRIREDKEVFMYSSLLAFCTAECRDMQIAMDTKARMGSKG